MPIPYDGILGNAFMTQTQAVISYKTKDIFVGEQAIPFSQEDTILLPARARTQNAYALSGNPPVLMVKPSGGYRTKGSRATTESGNPTPRKKYTEKSSSSESLFSFPKWVRNTPSSSPVGDEEMPSRTRTPPKVETPRPASPQSQTSPQTSLSVAHAPQAGTSRIKSRKAGKSSGPSSIVRTLQPRTSRDPTTARRPQEKSSTGTLPRPTLSP
ncbi:hypothetical protein KM043_000158, partial [Ampulex compressa]